MTWQGRSYVDFSTSYKINDHFKVSLEALNLTDEYRTDLVDSNAERLDNYLHTGRQYYTRPSVQLLIER